MKTRLVLALALLAALATTSAAQADPPGTVTVTDTRVPSVVTIRGASTAGLLYETDSSLGGHSAFWVQESGSAAVALGWAPGRPILNGRMVFDYTGSTVRYSDWNGPMHTCPVYEFGGVQYLPTGWAYFDKADSSIKKVTATESGCTTQTFLAPTSAVQPQEVIGGDANGMVIRTSHVAGGRDYLAYYRYSDPDHPVALDSPDRVFDRGRYDAVRGGVALVVANTGPGVTTRTWRIPLDGGTARELPAPPAPYWDVASATNTAVVTDQGVSTVPATGGSATTRAGVTGEVYSDGTAFYTGPGTGEQPGIYARSTATGSSTRVVSPPATTYASEQWGIALSPGRVYYTDRRPNGQNYPYRYDVRMRTTTTGPGTVAVGAEQTIGGVANYPSMSASAGRLVYDGNKQRTYTGSVLTMSTTPADLPEMSGNRWLIGWSSGSGADTMSGRTMYDVRTGKTVSGSAWPQGPQDLFGNYLLYARSDGGVRLRNLLTGTETSPRPAGSRLAAVAVHTQWAAWVTDCSGPDCTQTLSLRDLGTGTTRTLTTHHTTSLDLSGGYLAFDSGTSTSRELRTLRADTGAVQLIGSLPRYAGDGAVGELHFAPRHFDVDDEVIGWLDVNHTARLAHLAATIDAPRYLGNAIAASSFSISWSIALPVSKALPTCTVTILRAGATIRTLNCANTTGMVAVTWDGRNGSGAVQPAGTYTYRVSGQDDDNYWMRNYDGSLTSVTGTMTKTA